MNLSELFQKPGLGILATAGAGGSVNTAIYARPRVIDEKTLVWGMTDGRSYRNVSINPHASFLFKEDGHGFRGVRLVLERLKVEEGGDMLEAIRRNTSEVVGPGAGKAVNHAVWFRVVEVRSLI
jgi:hypothetical protein